MEKEKNHEEVSIYGKLQNYLREFVYGGIDGAVTTFAVVAGAVGANLDSSIIIILGFANLLADGFSMSIGAYLSSKSEKERYIRNRDVEYWEIDNLPEQERKEVVEIYQAKGFSGKLLDQVVDVIVSDRKRWVNEMMKNELNMVEDSKSPIKIGLATLISFVLIGFIPLIVYVYDLIKETDIFLFFWACLFTGVAFIAVGWLKSYVNQTNIFKSIFETLILGFLAALVAYFVGNFLQSLLSNS